MDALFSWLTPAPKPAALPLAKETGTLLGEMQKQVKSFENNAEVGKLHTAAKLALLEFKGVDCSGEAKIVDLEVGPAELISMSKKAVKSIEGPLRRVYLSVAAKNVERAIETLLTKMNGLVLLLRSLGRQKKINEMLAMVCFLQASINKLVEATEKTAAKAAAPLEMPKLTADAKALLEEVRMEHDFDMLDDLLAEARAQSIPDAPATKPQSKTRKGKGKSRDKTKTMRAVHERKLSTMRNRKHSHAKNRTRRLTHA
jgi:hypothetical protein